LNEGRNNVGKCNASLPMVAQHCYNVSDFYDVGPMSIRCGVVSWDDCIRHYYLPNLKRSRSRYIHIEKWVLPEYKHLIKHLDSGQYSVLLVSRGTKPQTYAYQ